MPAACQFIEARESRRLTVYLDSEQNPTIGVGFNLNRAGAQRSLDAIGVKKANLLAGQALTNEQVDTLLVNDVRDCIAAARAHVARFDGQPEAVRLIVVDLIFNLGITRFARFSKFREFIGTGEYSRAAGELMFKKPPKTELTGYFVQTKTRAIGHIATLHGLGRN